MKLLFITHETTRTGAPMVLLHFLRWLKKNKKDVEVDLVAINGGTLDEDFINACDTFFDFKRITISQKLSFIQRVFNKFNLYQPPNTNVNFINEIKSQNYDLVYANTVVSIPLAHQIATNNAIKCIAHIHELNDIIKQFLPNLKSYTNGLNKVISPSNLVCQNLINNWGIDSKKIDVVYECAEIIFEKQIKKKVSKVFRVGASGFVQIRKGFDLFIQVARQLFERYPDASIGFVWVGKIPNRYQFTIEEDLKKLNLSDKVIFTDEIKNPATIYSSFDIFLMTSREDAFPLVCIEVGILGKPIICFQGATGTEEIIKNGGGKIVPYLDVNAMAEQVIYYYNHPNAIKADGIFNKVAFSKFTPESICPKYFDAIIKTLQDD